VVAWLVGYLVDLLLLSNSEPYRTIFMNVCVVITVAKIMLLRYSGPYGIIFMAMCVYYFRLSRHS
jgi:hypothetical protein